MTPRALSASVTTVPLPVKVGATGGNAPSPRCPSPPVAALLALVFPIGAGDAEQCAETRRTLRRRAILRQTRTAALVERPNRYQDPRVIRARWRASLSSAAKDSRRQTEREELQKGDDVLATPAVKRVHGSHGIASTLRMVRKAFREDAFCWKACILAIRANEVSQGKSGKKTGAGTGKKMTMRTHLASEEIDISFVSHRSVCFITKRVPSESTKPQGTHS